MKTLTQHLVRTQAPRRTTLERLEVLGAWALGGLIGLALPLAVITYLLSLIAR